jgi:hypothetical protein
MNNADASHHWLIKFFGFKENFQAAGWLRCNSGALSLAKIAKTLAVFLPHYFLSGNTPHPKLSFLYLFNNFFLFF